MAQQQMTTRRKNNVLLSLLINRVNDYEPILVDEIKTIVDNKERKKAIKQFEKVFGKTPKSFVRKCPHSNVNLILVLENRKCDTEEKMNAVARIVATNVEIDGWNGRLG